ncbi:hypothetical protein BDN71DRAFT_1514186, partial [Pleurotus eryngii]
LDKYWAGFLYISYLTFYFNQHPNSITWTTPGSDDVRYLVLTNISDLATSKVHKFHSCQLQDIELQYSD